MVSCKKAKHAQTLRVVRTARDRSDILPAFATQHERGVNCMPGQYCPNMLIVGSLGPGRKMTAEEAVVLISKLSPQTPIIRGDKKGTRVYSGNGEMHFDEQIGKGEKNGSAHSKIQRRR